MAQTLGRIHSADHGTLFLDEIGDLPLEIQPKLLRVLQEKQFERLGGCHTVHVDVRMIAATNQDLGRMVEERKFRADLYYRLNVFPMLLPPLRERREDIPLLAEYFLERFAAQQRKAIETIPDEVLSALEHHDWPGNVRELQNVIERGVIMTSGSVLSRHTTEHLKASVVAPFRALPLAPSANVKTLADAERAHITATLRKTNWVVGGPFGAAAQLGLPRTTLMSKMHKLGIPTSQRRPGQSTTRMSLVTSDPQSRVTCTSEDDVQVLEAVAG